MWSDEVVAELSGPRGPGGGIVWMTPEKCVPPHRVTHPDRLAELARQFKARGRWGYGKPALLGYPDGMRIQLISGSHRWAAARQADVLIPVKVVSKRRVWDCWGDIGAWQELLMSAHGHLVVPSAP